MQTYRRDEVLELAVELAAEYGESLTLTAFRRETGLSRHVIFDLFGSWCELRVAAGGAAGAEQGFERDDPPADGGVGCRLR